METFVIVAFRVDNSRSVLYRKVDSLLKLFDAIERAFNEKEAQFISVRRVERCSS